MEAKGSETSLLEPLDDCNTPQKTQDTALDGRLIEFLIFVEEENGRNTLSNQEEVQP